MSRTLGIDRTFQGVGRVKLVTGTTNPVVRNKLSRMLTTLHEEGRLDLLRAIRDGKVAMLAVYDAFRRKALHEIPTGTTAVRIGDAFGAWFDSLRSPQDYSDESLRTMLTTKRRLEGFTKASVADAPAVLEQLRETLGREAPVSYNRTRAHITAFLAEDAKKLRDYLAKHTPA